METAPLSSIREDLRVDDPQGFLQIRVHYLTKWVNLLQTNEYSTIQLENRIQNKLGYHLQRMVH